MGNLLKILKICILNFRKWLISPRIYVVAALVLVFTNMVISPIVDFANSVEENVTPWLLPFIMSDNYMAITIFACAVLLFCDAPFTDEQQPYVIIRSNKICWAAGQILYIIISGFIFSLFLFASVCINIISVIDFSDDWGKIIGTLTQTNAGSQFNSYIFFDYSIMKNFSAISATAITLLLVWLVSVLIGLLVFFINTHLNNIIGPIVAFAFVLFQYLVPIIRIDSLYYLSPVSWVNLRNIDFKGISFYPSFEFVIITLLVLIFLLIVSVLISYKKSEIKTQTLL